MADSTLYEGQHLTVLTRGDGIARATLGVGDGGDATLQRDLLETRTALADARSDAVVLTGPRDAFDRATVPGAADDDEARVKSAGTELAFDAIATLDRPVVAAIDGAASGAGLALVLTCDLRVGGATSTYTLGGSGESPSTTTRRRLCGTVGHSRTESLLTASEPVDAADAASWGLLSEVVPDDDVAEQAHELAESLAELPRVPYRYITWALRAASPVPSGERDLDWETLRPLPAAVEAAGPVDDTTQDPDASVGEPEQAADDHHRVTVDRPRDGVVRLTIDRRRRLNALDGPTITAFLAALDEVAAQGVDAVVLEGAGRRAFSIGMDLQAPICQVADPARGAAISRLGQRATRAIESLDAPVVAAVAGRALGGGFELALACDRRIGGASSSYGLPEVTHGLLPGAGGTQRLPAIVGTGRAAELLLSGETYDASTMEEWDVLDAVVPDEAVSDAALDEAERLASDVATPGTPVDDATAPAPLGYFFERAGLAHCFDLDPFDLTDGDEATD